VLLFIDNIFRYMQAGSEVSALLGRMPSAVGYQPSLGTEMGLLEERITSTRKGSITRCKPCTSRRRLHRPRRGDDVRTSRRVDRAFARDLELGIYPAVDPLASSSRILDPLIVGAEHYRVARGVQEHCSATKTCKTSSRFSASKNSPTTTSKSSAARAACSACSRSVLRGRTVPGAPVPTSSSKTRSPRSRKSSTATRSLAGAGLLHGRRHRRSEGQRREDGHQSLDGKRGSVHADHPARDRVRRRRGTGHCGRHRRRNRHYGPARAVSDRASAGVLRANVRDGSGIMRMELACVRAFCKHFRQSHGVNRCRLRRGRSRRRSKPRRTCGGAGRTKEAGSDLAAWKRAQSKIDFATAKLKVVGVTN